MLHRMTRTAYGFGLTTISANGTLLDAWFPQPALGDPPANAAAPDYLLPLTNTDADREITRDICCVHIDLDQAPKDAADAYLRLHLLSSRLAAPNSLNLEGIFGVLTNVVWTSRGPCAPESFTRVRANLLASGPVHVWGIDKFPRMTDYVTPSGVRIADANRVRLGAHLAEGTTVMHEGFCNFNAGTLGASMVEGRISAGVVVDDDSDIGGGASIMGTLSGGGREQISIGKRCLLGANSGVGISLGDDCIVEAGLYLTAGSKVIMPNGQVRKASYLSGHNGMLFLRNSLSGKLQVNFRKNAGVSLNEVLHTN